MPTARVEMASVTIAGNIYLIGGYSDKATNKVEVYDSSTDEWSTIAPLPKKLDHLAAASFNNKIYVVGGFDEKSEPSNRLFIYDPVLGKWEQGKEMSTARGALIAEFIDGVLYAIGGDEDPSYVTGSYHPYGQTARNEAYDPATDSWIEKTPMTTARHHHVSAVVGENLYVIGGRYGLSYADHNFNNTDANEVYNPTENKWTVMKSIPTARSGAAAASVNGSIYVIGGETNNYPSESEHTYSENEKYVSSSNMWIFEESMSTGRHGLSAESINDKIFVIGGGEKPGFTVSNKNEIYNGASATNSKCIHN